MLLGTIEADAATIDIACPRFEEAIAVARGSDFLDADPSTFLAGTALYRRGELHHGLVILEESLATARLRSEPLYVGLAASYLASVATALGDYERGRSSGQEALSIVRRCGLGIEAEAASGLGGHQYAVGDLQSAASTLEGQSERLRATGNRRQMALCLPILGAVALARGALDEARLHLEHALSVTESYPVLRGQPCLELARLARLEDDAVQAETLGHEALQVLAATGYHLLIPDVVETLAGLAADQASHPEAARLFGAAQAQRDAMGSVRFPVLQDGFERDVEVVRGGLSAEQFVAAWGEGTAMSLAEAVGYVERGRGARKRPSAGWAALTPTELDVVRLVAQGLTNPEIAKRLFIARNTVKVHLTHIFSKLGVSARAELAAEAARHGM
jgi:DNA-binding CsgD family transcriptional regulator